MAKAPQQPAAAYEHPFKLASGFMEQAHRDLDVAELLFANDRLEWCCYAAQQSAEKMLKAIRLICGSPIETIKVHDIAILVGTINQWGAGWDQQFLTELIELGRHVEAARYPGAAKTKSTWKAPSMRYIAAEADRAVKTARRLWAYCHPLFNDLLLFWANQTRSP